MAATILKIRGDDAPPGRPPAAGFATVPRHVIRNADLSHGACRLLGAIIGLCYGDSRTTKATAGQIAEQAGMTVKSVRYFLPQLIAARLIVRRRDPDAPGGPWLTCLDCDPRGFELTNEPPKWRVLDAPPPTPNLGRGIPTERVDPYPPGGYPIQKTLDFGLESSPQPPAGGGQEGVRPKRKPRRSRFEEILDTYREWANEPTTE